MTKSVTELLSRAFATIDQDPITGEQRPTIIDEHSVVTGYHFLAPFEVESLVKQIRASIANNDTDTDEHNHN